MPSPRFSGLIALAAAGLVTGAVAAQETAQLGAPGWGFGSPISDADLAAWHIDIRTPDGKGLPPGQGTAVEGREIYEVQCMHCHGEEAEGGPMYGTMVGGINSFVTDQRIVTPGSMYPYAPILFDYIRRTMPMDAPQALSADEIYAVSAYLLHLNELWGESDVLDAESMVAIEMPNRDGFIEDDRPDTKAVRCLSNCETAITFDPED
jgi:S-disulfanyl-L-cysteine oxidoreductase SoxD